MIYEVKPAEGFRCSVNVPGSKSITNRALIIGALATGKTTLENVLFSDDTRYMIDALKTLGCDIRIDETNHNVEVNGIGNAFLRGQCFVGNAGTAMRFLPSFIAVKGGDVELTGVERMKNRPIDELINMLRKLGVNIDYLEKEGYPPIKIQSKGINGGSLKVKGNISSQFVSSILLSSPYAKSDVYIEVEEDLVSKPYIDITLGIMQDFGIEVENFAYKNFYIRSGQIYQCRKYIIESDGSAASYFFAAAAVAKGDITVKNLNPYSVQGDIRFIDILEKMGAKVERGTDYVRVVGDKLKGVSVDMNDMPDVAQTLAIVALFAQGPTEIKNVYNMRLKETDRLKALNIELTKLGAEVVEKKDGLIIYPADDYKPADIGTYDDHRMAMSFAVAGLKISGIRIKDSECVAKTFPEYFKEFEKIYEKV